MVEIALMSPWIFLLFMAVFDAGFYLYAAISTANAARVAAMYTSSSSASLDDSGTACSYALEEMRPLSNVGASTSCAALCAAGSACKAGPITVTAARIAAPASPDGGAAATQVAVQYQTVNLFTLPWLPGQMTITRTTQMRVAE